MPALQKNRFELKYVIEEAKARTIRQYLLSYLEGDEFNNPALPGYHIHSLYLDSPDLELAKATMKGLKNRYKLRIRIYDEKPETPAFCEIKRRVNDTILKQRATVHKWAANRILAGEWPAKNFMRKYSDEDYGSLQQFCRLKSIINADGTAFVSYLREAFISPNDSSVRVTFDRALTAGTYDKKELVIREPRFKTQIKMPNGDDGVVLELKFTERFPNWMRELVHIFNLQRCAMPKYVKCITALQRDKSREINLMIGKPYE